MRKIALFLLIFAIVVLAVTCNKKTTQVGSFSADTGVLDNNGNIISTNEYFITNIVWTTNGIYLTNVHDKTNTHEVWITNVYVPPSKASDFYTVHMPYAASGTHNHTVSYKDQTRLKQLWLDQINGKGHTTGKKFNIRNRDNGLGRIAYKQSKDYYYFDNNANIYYAADGRMIKKFEGAVIVKRRYDGQAADYYVIGGLYSTAVYKNGAQGYDTIYRGTQPNNGVYDFIVARIEQKIMQAGWTSRYVLQRDFDHGYLEVIVLNTKYWPRYEEYGVDSYFHNFASTANKDPDLPFMTNASLYLDERPEYIIPFLDKTVHFSAWERWNRWKYSFVSDY